MKRVALITGGSRGIGFGIAEQLAKQGFDLAVNGTRVQKEVEEALEKLRLSGSEVIYCQGDISLAAGREAILGRVKAHFNRLHVLVNNAGKAPRERKDILEATEESFDDVVSTNLKGTYFLTQQAANWMINQQQLDSAFAACIINVTSISATVASVNRGEYCISKAGLAMATQLFAVRLGEFNIPVFEIRPGVIHTDMTAAVEGKYDRLIREGLCLQKRWGEPEDVGKVAAALATGDFGYSTGQIFLVDGGLTVARF
jgi:3-oxoacyl-[acyl-carrier protein] reductase